MSHWTHQSLMMAFVKMERHGVTSDCFTKMIISALNVNCGLDSKSIASKLLCFGANEVTKKIKEDYASFATITYYVHCLQLWHLLRQCYYIAILTLHIH